MKSNGLTFLAGGASLLLSLAACSGGSSSGSGGASTGPMFVDTCSLGCSGGAGGVQVSCSTVATSVNNEISVYFSQAVKGNSVSSTTFQLIDVNSGQVPIGTRFVDPNNPRRVVFRPSVSFDSLGNASFGFAPNTTYRITIPGQAQGDNPPYITSQGGKANRSRMQCDILTNQGVTDLVTGPPVVTVLVDLAILSTPDPNDRLPLQDAMNADNVWRSSKITMSFNDFMNPVTLINQATGQSTFITIKVDPDGNPSTTADQVPLSGSYAINIDPDNLRTLLVFTSPTGLPSGGAAHTRKVLVTIPDNIQDLSGKPLANAGTFAFTPETVSQQPVTLPDTDGENFTDTANCDLKASSADWGSGRLVRGHGGGSGRLGKLLVKSGQTLTLNTDSQLFPLPNTARDLLDNTTSVIDYNPIQPATWPTLTITDGVFEFSSISIESGGTLAFTGSRPARLLCRGTCDILGIIDLRGSTPLPFDSATARGQNGSPGGVAGGTGGKGGDRSDQTNSTGLNGLLSVGGISNPGADVNGFPSSGIDLQVGGFGAASGGQHFPPGYPLTQIAFPPDIQDLLFTDQGDETCLSFMVANGGGGGGYGLAGTNAVPNTLITTAIGGGSNLPPTLAGDADGDGGAGGTAINIEPPDPESGHFVRRLDFNQGFLRGGSGGGGGGGNLFGSASNGIAPGCIGPGNRINQFRDQSSCGGGGGGGALQVVSGKTLRLGGLINTRGGNGGSALTPVTGPPTRNHRAAPGGAGSGGAVRVQGVVVTIDPTQTPGTTGHIDVRGGTGGGTDYCVAAGTCMARSLGGAGGPGLIRIEDTTAVLTRASEAPKLLPFNVSDLESRDWLSVGTWLLPRRRPESFTGAVSCWMRPTGNFFEVNFQADTPAAVDPEERFGWNMEVLYDDGGPLGERVINYRGPDPDSPFADDLQTVLNDNLNYGVPPGQRSYFAVRFQGARLLTNYNGSLCDVNVGDGSATPNIVDGSLTPWVRHPSELNAFSPRPTMVRFTITFDTQLEVPGTVPSFIKGLRNLKIRTKPD